MRYCRSLIFLLFPCVMYAGGSRSHEPRLTSQEAHSLVDKAVEKETIAKQYYKDSDLNLTETDQNKAYLNEVALLYEEAAKLMQEAYDGFSISVDCSNEYKQYLVQQIEKYQALSQEVRDKVNNWNHIVEIKKRELAADMYRLIEDAKVFASKGLDTQSAQLYQQALSIVKQLIAHSEAAEKANFERIVKDIEGILSHYHQKKDNVVLTQVDPVSDAAFQKRQNKLKEMFFDKDLIVSMDKVKFNGGYHRKLPYAEPLDGIAQRHENHFVIYAGHFGRFFMQSNKPTTHLHVKLFKQGKHLHTEAIELPIHDTKKWHNHIAVDGMLFAPETKLKKNFGIDLKLQFVHDASAAFSMVVSQKSEDAGYQLVFSLDGEGASLFTTEFSYPPPWQLSALLGPPSGSAIKKEGRELSVETKSTFPKRTPGQINHDYKDPFVSEEAAVILDQLLEELHFDPILIAQYVYQEIEFWDPILAYNAGVFTPPAVQRSPLITYLTKQGSPWEQCILLVYLLRRGGFNASCFDGMSWSLPQHVAENLLRSTIPESEKKTELTAGCFLKTKNRTAILSYPGVYVSHQNDSVLLCPWMQEVQVTKGSDLYQYLPHKYGSADRWVLEYLKGDENILQWIGPDEDDSAALLFTRFVQAELRKQGLALSDVGRQETKVKRQIQSWSDFPVPDLYGENLVLAEGGPDSVPYKNVSIEVRSLSIPEHKLVYSLPLAALSPSGIPVRFVPHESGYVKLGVTFPGEKEQFLDLTNEEHFIEIELGLKTNKQVFTIKTGTECCICFSFDGSSSGITQYLHQKFTDEQDESRKPHQLLSFVGGAYFEKCARSHERFAQLHNVKNPYYLGFGLAKFTPSRGKDNEDVVWLPQVDMFFHCRGSSFQHMDQNIYETAGLKDYLLLTNVDNSSNEHQVLREIFQDSQTVSTVKLLQLAHLEHIRAGKEGAGFVVLTPDSLEEIENNPDQAKQQYYSHLDDLNLFGVKQETKNQWETIQRMFEEQEENGFSYAYVTPGNTSGGQYQEAGSLVVVPNGLGAFISHNSLVSRGGLGNPLPGQYFQPGMVGQWQLTPSYYGGFNSYAVTLPNSFDLGAEFSFPYGYGNDLSFMNLIPNSEEKISLKSDVRFGHKTPFNSVADPVDVVSGAFYIDDLDLFLPGVFPLEIRRNYNSQNPQPGPMGYGWKMSLNPFLVEEEGKLFAAEIDGTVLAYRYNPSTKRYEVHPEDNPDLYYLHQGRDQINPFQAYIKDNVLYSPDGSERFFEDGLLKKWVNSQGMTLTFLYEEKRLVRIESSNGDFCGFRYDPQGYISQMYTKDGRRINYTYSARGDLVSITLPNTGKITYEYDGNHRVVRETKPHGYLLENIYDKEGRVIEQRSPVGVQQRMRTSATFVYEPGETIVIDPLGEKTTYQIFDKQIYKITDPLGAVIEMSWFVDEYSWFDATKGKVVAYQGSGAMPRGLKETSDKRGLRSSYRYDTRGNIATITVQGEDLTGDGVQEMTKTRSYNERNLCIEEKVGQRRIVTTYDRKFSYLPFRIETYSGTTRISQTQYTYNEKGYVTKEDRNGAITHFKYNPRGLVAEKIQETGTNDPDVVETYEYNLQGQCTQVVSDWGVEKRAYDIMGNLLSSEKYHGNQLLSASYAGYNLNNHPIWQQTAQSEHTLFFDYTASGQIKASRFEINRGVDNLYNLYEYDARGSLIEQVDARGFSTYRTYDGIGNMLSETKEGATTRYAYEPGGLVSEVTTPGGGVTKRRYTTNGFLKEEIYPDGTSLRIVYDLFGRKIKETKLGSTWKIDYNDAGFETTTTHEASNTCETTTYHPNGYILTHTDQEGHTVVKKSDHLGRVIEETSPSGQKVAWSYNKNVSTCQLPSGETRVETKTIGKTASYQVYSASGELLESSSVSINPITNTETTQVGELTTITRRNIWDLPDLVQKGEIITKYRYDACGNCAEIIDGEGRVTQQKFDGLGRIVVKILPDGAHTGFVYDKDSNLIESHLPNGNTWKASYDLMGRKTEEYVEEGWSSSSYWKYRYKQGYLVETIDPQGRKCYYTYDSLGRRASESVAGWKKQYEYDKKGQLICVEQNSEYAPGFITGLWSSDSHQSKVSRSYDEDGRLTEEVVSLAGQQIQKTVQTWDKATRTLQIGSHRRAYTYQNGKMVQQSAQGAVVSYVYKNGLLEKIQTPNTSIDTNYSPSGLPQQIQHHLPGQQYQETMEWTRAGKLALWQTPEEQKHFTYTKRGYLARAGQEEYGFDFGQAGLGVRTHSPSYQTVDLDSFGRATNEQVGNQTLATNYDAMGQVSSQGDRMLQWDPWGNLIKVTDPAFVWEAFYDPLGRRIQTKHTPTGDTEEVATSYYDPEEEFAEIGVHTADNTYWKLLHANRCDVVVDQDGKAVSLVHTTLGELIAVVGSDEMVWTERICSAYGPLQIPEKGVDVVGFAKEMSWRGHRTDPTGWIWMGARTYDPKAGRFLSADPVGYPMNLDLYGYAGGDPVNYMDPDGRFKSYVYSNNTMAQAGMGSFAEALRAAVYGPLSVAVQDWHPTTTLFASRELNNALAQQAVEQGMTRADIFTVNAGKGSPGIFFVNGICNSIEEAMGNARYISKLGGGVQVQGIYNPTYSMVGDVVTSFFAKRQYQAPPAEVLAQRLREFLKNHGPHAIALIIAHSGGGGHTKNALLLLTPEERKRCDVVSINSFKMISKDICRNSYNYASQWDFVARLNWENRDELIILKTHPDAGWWDHPFQSPTFRERLHDRILNYLGEN